MESALNILYTFVYYVHSVNFCIFEFPVNAEKSAMY